MASVNASHDDDEDAAVDSINITPLVDVLMVVLVMFILTATAQVSGIALLEAIESSDPTALIGLPLMRTCTLLQAAGQFEPRSVITKMAIEKI